MRRELLAALFASACSGHVSTTTDAPKNGSADSGVDPYDGAVSGTRLKLTWFNFADGTRTWNAFYDSQRKENCYIYESWLDGGTYCAPDNSGSIVYTDSGCTQKAIQSYVDPTCPRMPALYTMEWNFGTCTSQPGHLWTRAGKFSLASYYYKYSDGSCGGPFSGSGYDYYSVGAEVRTADLVRMQLGAPVGAQRLSERFYESSDGLKVPWQIHDAMLGVDCYPAYTPSNNTTTSCAPGNAAYAYYYHDNACSQPELEQAKTCQRPQYAVSYPANACPDDPGNYYVVGATVATPPLYTSGTNTCTATTGTTTNNYYQMDQQLALATVMRAPDSVPGHRIQLVHYTTPDGLKLRDYAMYDSQDAAECYPTTLPDGTIRCVVYGGYTQQFFTNSACSLAIDLVELTTGAASCTAPPVPKYARKYITPPPGSCTYSTEVHLVGSQYTGAVYTNSGTCTLYSHPQSKLYNLGAMVPLTDFVTASISIDP